MITKSLTELRKNAETITETKAIQLKNGQTYYLNPVNYANPNLERAYVIQGGNIGFVYKAILYILEFSKSVIELLEKRSFKYKQFYIPDN